MPDLQDPDLPRRGQACRGGAARPAPRRLRRLCCGLLGALALQPALSAEAALGSDVHGLLALARGQSPELAMARLEADAALQRVEPAGALPDPVLRVELMNVNNYGRDAAFNLLPANVGETRYTLMQQLPWWGKRDLRRDAAAADARAASARSEAAWSDLAERIKTAYAEYYRSAGNQRLVGEVLALLVRLEQVAQVRYAGGLAGQADAIRAQLEQTAMQAELIALDGERRQQHARLNALLARERSAPLAEPLALRPLPALAPADALALAERARARNPQLQAEAARLAAAQRQRELTLRNRYPDLTVGVSPTQTGSRITTWGLMLELNIPLQQDTRRSQEREAEAMVAAAQARSDALAQQLLGDLAVRLAGLDAAQRSAALLTAQLLPQSELGQRSALSAYENGKADFAVVLEALRQSRTARQSLLKSQVEAQLRLAEIERILGDDL